MLKVRKKSTEEGGYCRRRVHRGDGGGGLSIAYRVEIPKASNPEKLRKDGITHRYGRGDTHPVLKSIEWGLLSEPALISLLFL